MRKIIVTSLALLIFYSSQAQSKSTNSSSYQTALGVKVWDGGGISLKHFINGNNALEGIAYFWRQGIRITGLYEIHGPISGATGLQWYIGPGAHLGFTIPEMVTVVLSGLMGYLDLIINSKALQSICLLTGNHLLNLVITADLSAVGED
jgi:hypothetical protein